MKKNKFLLVGLIGLLLTVRMFLTGCDIDGGDDPIILKWTEGSLPYANAEAWYDFPVKSGTTYHVWVKDYWSPSATIQGGTVQWADVLVTARYGSRTGAIIFEDSNRGYDSSTNAQAGAQSPTNLIPSNFTANQDATVHLRVYPNLIKMGNKFKVAVTTSNKRPSGE